MSQQKNTEKLQHWKLDKFVEYANNPRKNDHAVDKIAAAINEFGFRIPIVAKSDGLIVDGHLRFKAAKKLGLDTVPVLLADDMTEQQIKAFRLSVNKMADLAEWDEELLAMELSELAEFDFDMDLIGFTTEELEDLLGGGSDGGLTEEDTVPVVPENPVAREGDVWILGNHRLMCGDSTNAGTVALLMDGAKADMVFTDPPYNIDYQGVSDKHDKIKNDKMSDESFIKFLEDSLMDSEIMYVCCSWQNCHLFKKAMENIDRKPKAMIVWDKVNPAQNLDKYYKQHELIFYYGDFGGSNTIRGDVWELKRQKNTVHPTMKPVELIQMALEDHPNKKNIYDGFGGSGSTLIACEKINRQCFMMEIDPHYIDVIIQRWESFSGKEAWLENEDITYKQRAAG